ncbi:hypothetical protein ACFFJY_03020 [Fictibacillus aquaticus]|uniref:Uncharacterized protein n=1 Tax=Fictibacillus aquaticus TaxID=2021314 RepID=A0A235F8N2_9BACL|nr:hypothetical protein [Fictibacillus aquaticus]OYD57670.1 hypothetical protein CGZ90_13475 [Fictibacillus aquaticus]
MTNTKKMLGGLLSAAVMLSGCSTSYTESYDEEIYDEEVYTEPDFENDYSSDTSYYPEDDEGYGEIELDHLQSYYPDLDLEAMEDYLEENGLEYNEEELIAFLDDLQENGETTVYDNYYADENAFPWWIFLLANTTKTKPSSKIKFTKPTTKPTTTTTTKSTTKKSSGFGSGSTSSGS